MRGCERGGNQCRIETSKSKAARESDAAACEPFCQVLSCSGETRKNGPSRAAEFARGFFGRVAAEVTQHHGPPKPFWKARDLRIENRSEFGALCCDVWRFRRDFDDRLNGGPVSQRSTRNATSNFEQPPTEITANRPRFSRQDKKNRLKGVFRELFVANGSPAQTENHTAMPPYE